MPLYLTPVNLSQNELRNAVVQNLSTSPSSPKLGQVYYDTGLLQFLQWNGTAWANSATNATNLNGQAASYYLNRANQTGSQLASTISNLSSTVQAYTLDSFGAPANSVSFNAKNITSLADPVNPQDAATKNYVDTNIQSSAAGIVSKPAVTVVSTANVSSLSGLPTVDGVTLTTGQRILLTAQTTASQNGPYIVGSGAWTRPTDDGATGELTTGALWLVSQGTQYARTQWILATTGAITPGTTSVTINAYGAGLVYTASNGVLLTGGNFTAQVVSTGGLQIAASGLSILLPSTGGLQTTATGLSILLPAASGLVSDATGLHIDTTVVARKYATALGDGSTTSYTITHNLNTQDVQITVKDTSGNVVYPDVQANAANTIVVSFSVAPATNAYRVVVTG